MGLPGVLSIGQVIEGSVVRVSLRRASPFRSPANAGNRGLFRVIDADDRASLDPRVWRKIVGSIPTKFVARVILNNVAGRELTLQIEDAKTNRRADRIRFEVILPYSELRRLACLVYQARTFDSDEAEQKFRRQHRQSAANKAYFDPKDRFVGVELVA